MSAPTTTDKPKKPENDIRIGMNSRVRNVIRYASNIMKEKNLKELKFSAVGGSIGRLLDTVEVLKILIPGLYQQNKITSVAYQTLDSGNNVLNQKLYPKMEVILTTEEPKNKNEGTQDKLNEEDRKKIEKIMNERREEREKNRGGRGRRGQRGRRGMGFRGRRALEEEELLEEEEVSEEEEQEETLEEEVEETIEEVQLIEVEEENKYFQ